MEEKQPTTRVERLANLVWIEPLMGAMVAVYSILTAFASYNTAIYGSQSGSQYFLAVTEMTIATSEYALSDQIYTQDVMLLTEYDVQSGTGASQEVLDSILSDLSEAATDAVERSGDIDEQYTDEIYETPDEFLNNAGFAFQAGGEWNRLSDAYQLWVLLLAVGLGLVAWAALMDELSLMRYIFLGISTIILIGSLAYGVELTSRERPFVVESADPDYLGLYEDFVDDMLQDEDFE